MTNLAQVSLFDDPPAAVAVQAIPKHYGDGKYPEVTPARVKACQDLATVTVNNPSLSASFAEEASEIREALAAIEAEPLPSGSPDQLRARRNRAARELEVQRMDGQPGTELLKEVGRCERALFNTGAMRYEGWNMAAYEGQKAL